jgi:hypothetical protein
MSGKIYYLKDNRTDLPFIETLTGLPFITTDRRNALVYADLLRPPWRVAQWTPTGLADAPFDDVIIDELATNPGPYTSPHLQLDGGWWQRTLDQINALTIHHTLSDSPHATAARYVNKNGGRPTIPYTVWITQTGQTLLCVTLTQGLWHDHTGHENMHLSVGLAGELHKYRPADVQLSAAAELCAWAIRSNALPNVDSPLDIKGHQDYIATTCPGWASEASGNWKDDFYQLLEAAL